MTVSILNQQKHFAAFADGSLLIKETSSLTFVHHQRTKVAPGAPPPPHRNQEQQNKFAPLWC